VISKEEIARVTYSLHAKKRMQQRGINKQVVEFILEHGVKQKTHEDDRYIFNEKKQKKFNREVLNNLVYKKFDKQISSTALVVNDMCVITAYKIQGRIWN
jgi:hypothetical protein